MGTRILTVEDDERIRTAVRMALEDEGWEVAEADNGEDALLKFGQQPTDVVLIDIMLPGIDGFDVCRSIRRVSDVPIVMVTARAGRSYPQFLMADLTRSRLSRTAVSGRPTIWVWGIPMWTSTSTTTGRASTPQGVADPIRASITLYKT